MQKFEDLLYKYNSLDGDLIEEFTKNFVKLRSNHLMIKYMSRTIEKNYEYVKTAFNFIDAYYSLLNFEVEMSIYFKKLMFETINKKFKIENFISKNKLDSESNNNSFNLDDYDGEEKMTIISELLFKKCEISDLSTIVGIYKYVVDDVIFYKFISLGIGERTACLYQYVSFAKIDKDGNFYDVFRQLNPTEIENELIKYQDIDLNSFYEIDFSRDRMFRTAEEDELKPVLSWDIRIPVYKLYYIEEDKRKDLFKEFNCLDSINKASKEIANLYSVILFVFKINSIPKEFDNIITSSRTFKQLN